MTASLDISSFFGYVWNLTRARWRETELGKRREHRESGGGSFLSNKRKKKGVPSGGMREKKRIGVAKEKGKTQV